MAYQIKQSTTAYPLVFLMVSSSDHVTPVTGASPTVTLSKTGGSFASPSGAVTEIANGWYKVAGNATDSNTLGPLILHASAASSDPTEMVFEVVAFDPQDAVRQGLTALPNVASGSAGAVLTSGTGTAQLSVSSGLVTLAASQTYNVTGNITGNLSGSVGSVTGAVGSVTGAVGSVTTVSDKTGYTLSNAGVDALFTRALTEAYPTDGQTMTVAQALYLISQTIGEFSISGTVITVKKLDGSTTAATYTLDSSTAPSSRTRAS